MASRPTKQRQAVMDVLAEHGDFLSARQLHNELSQRGASIGLATVYRSLALLVDSGEADLILREDGEAAYRRCSQAHHHHLVCRSCGRTVEVAGPAVERWANRVAAEHGFSRRAAQLGTVRVVRRVFGGRRLTWSAHGPFTDPRNRR